MNTAQITAWIGDHGALLAALGVVGIVSLAASVALLPLVLLRLPSDYFLAPQRAPASTRRHPLLRRVLAVTRNALGGLLVLAGLAMLVLPGQGLLTILVGCLVADFPGKYALERRLVARPGVLRSINWLRRRAGRPPLHAPAPQPRQSSSSRS
jgi:hypothetical protein